MLNGSMIIERIENDNGTAIKFDDGTLIQCGTKYFSGLPITRPYGLTGSNDYFAQVDLVFPIAFTGINSILCTVNSPNHLVSYAGRYRRNDKFGGYVFISTSLTITIEIYWMAIGRWK